MPTPLIANGFFGSGITGHLANSNFYSIATATGTGSSTTLVLGSIPNTYTHLQIRFTGFVASAPSDVVMKIGSNAGLIDHYLTGNGSNAVAATDSPATNGLYISNSGFSTTYPTVGIIDFLDYTNTNKNATFRLFGARDENGSGRVWLASGLYSGGNPISSITFTSLGNNFTTNTQFALYGVK